MAELVEDECQLDRSFKVSSRFVTIYDEIYDNLLELDEQGKVGA